MPRRLIFFAKPIGDSLIGQIHHFVCGRPKTSLPLAMLFALNVFLAPKQAFAVPITWRVEGLVNEVFDPTYQIYPTWVNYGDRLTVDVTFESETPPGLPDWCSNPDTCPSSDVAYRNPVLTLEGTVGRLTFTLAADGETSVHIQNNALLWEAPRLDSFGMAADVEIFGQVASFVYSLQDYSGNALSSTALPLVPPNLSSIQEPKEFEFFWPAGWFVRGDLTTMMLIPEPTTLSALLMLTILAARRHARRLRNITCP